MTGITLRRLNHITVNAPSGEQEKARWFYSTILGLKEIPIPERLKKIYEIMWFECLNFIIHIEFVKKFIRPPEEVDHGVILPGRHIALEVKNIQSVRKKFEEAHLEIREAVALTDRDRFYVLDPFGNFYEIIEFHKDQK